MGNRVVEVINPIPELREMKLRKIIRVAVYARVSTSSDEQLNSFEAQKSYYESYVQKHTGWILAGIYADEGITGTSYRNRTEFKRMIDDALNRKIDFIITKSISRFARNTVDTLTQTRLLKSHGIPVYFEREDINTLDSKGEFMLTLLSSMAQEEARSISENLSWGIRKRMQEGKYQLNYKNFLGYCKGKEKPLDIVPEERFPICLIYYLHICGYTPSRIAKKLEKLGILSPAGLEVWQASTVNNILHNEKYCGNALLQKTFIEDFLTKKMRKNKGQLPQYFVKEDHDPIICQTVWDYTQSLLNERGRHYSSVGLSGILKCGACGSNYMRVVRRGKYNPPVCFYRCIHKFNLKDTHPCTNMYIYEPEAYRIISGLLFSIIPSVPTITDSLSRLIKEVIADENRSRAIVRYLDDSELPWLTCEVPLREIIILVRKATIMPNRVMIIEMIDGTVLSAPIRRWTPRKGEKD